MSDCYLRDYWELIKTGQVVTGYWLRKQVRNLIEDLDNPRYVYDTTEAHKRMKFQETFCLQSKQPYYMKPIILLPWQKAWWEAVYSFRMADTGLRRFTEGLLEVARKNGKSTMLAADGTTDLFIGEGGMDICCASNDDNQAKLIWSEIAGMRERIDPKRAVTRPTLVQLKNTARNITVFRLSSKTQNKDGYNISKTYLDESHDISEDNGASEVAEACWRGMSSKDEPFFVNTTTQGFNRDCYLDRKIALAKRIIEGELEDEHFIAFLYEQDSEQEVWQDEASWEKSNPSLRYGIKKIAKLRRDLETAKVDRATRIHMLTKDFNIPQSSAQAWLMLEDYDYEQRVYDLEEFRDSYCLVACDFAATTDLVNIKAMLMKPEENTKYVWSHYFIPESKLENSDDKEAGARYEEWARDGSLTIHEGNEVDIAAVAEYICDTLLLQYAIRPFKIGYDQRYAKPFIERCNDYGFDTEMLAQGRNLSNAMKLTEADLKTRVINYNSDPMDKWCLGNTCCEVDKVANIQPVKIPGQASKRIDGGVTLIMLEEVYRRYRNDFLTLCGHGKTDEVKNGMA